MTEFATTTIGLDIGDKKSVVCVLNAEGEAIEEARVATTPEGIERYFRGGEPARVVLEVGTHSPWISRMLKEMGHEVLVANARRVKLISENYRKSDQVDAELLARLGRADPLLLSPINHRGQVAQSDLAQIRARDALVRARTKLINAARGLAKSQAVKLPSCSTASFHKNALKEAPEGFGEALGPLLDSIDKLTSEIRAYDKRFVNLCETKYRDAQPLLTIKGVAELTALCYVLTLEAPGRFANARSVGPYLGLVGKRGQSGNTDPNLGISKAGDPYLRKLLVQCAHYILGPFGCDSALRRWGLKLAAQGGKGAKKRAAVAVARKLATIMYILWATGATYQCFPQGLASKDAPEKNAPELGSA